MYARYLPQNIQHKGRKIWCYLKSNNHTPTGFSYALDARETVLPQRLLRENVSNQSMIDM
jgi:hypothetical protein